MPFLNLLVPSRFILQNRENREFPSPKRELIFVLELKFSGCHKICLGGARDLNIVLQMSKMNKRLDSKDVWAYLVPKSMPTKVDSKFQEKKI